MINTKKLTEEYLDNLKIKSVLDLGCGKGFKSLKPEGKIFPQFPKPLKTPSSSPKHETQTKLKSSNLLNNSSRLLSSDFFCRLVLHYSSRNINVLES